MILRAVVAAQDRKIRERIARLLAGGEVLLTPAPSLRKILSLPESQTCDVIIAAATRADADPVEALEVTSALPDRPDVICLTDGHDHGLEARLLEAGAVAVVSIDLSDHELAGALQALLDRRRATHPWQADHPRAPLRPPPASPAMHELLRLADRVAAGDSSVLILGETGTGKEWLARRIHANSRRSPGPFVPLNCAGIAEGLIESELFGHAKGAFTGAVRSKRGHFEVAHGGTLFLDEIGDISPAVQVRLLRVLQDHICQPVGSEKGIQVDVRIIAATNRLLEKAVRDGSFRQDLYYRLAVISLHLPPLRERPEDIPGLLDAYSLHFATQLGRRVPVVSQSAREALARYSWPGNIRELINVVERSVLLATDSTIHHVDLPAPFWMDPAPGASQTDYPSGPDPSRLSPTTYSEARDEALAAFDLRYLTALLRRTGGRVGTAAKLAGVSSRTLFRKMKERGLRKEDFKV